MIERQQVKRRALFVVCVSLVGGCGLNDSISPSADDSPACEAKTPVDDATRLAAFESTVLALSSQRCAACHGSAQAPTFAAANSAQAFEVARPYLVSTGSALETRAGNGHCGGHCLDSASMKSAITEYLKLTASESQACNSLREEEALPANERVITLSSLLSRVSTSSSIEETFLLNTSDPSIPMKWRDLSLSAEIRGFQSPTSSIKGSIIIKNIKVKSPTSAVRVSDLYFVINGNTDESNTSFAGLAKELAASNLAQSLTPAGESTLLQVGWGSAGESLALSLVLREVTGTGGGTDNGGSGAGTSAGLSETETFVQKVKPILSMYCFNCHSVSRSAANSSFATPTDNDSALRENCISKSNKANPDNSLLLQKGTGAVTHAGGNSLPNVTDLNILREWMKTIP